MATREEKMEAFGQLLDILDELRVKCPWDRKQTNESLRTNTIEETYELCEALMREDNTNIKKELGDLLLHIVFYSKIGEEKEAFDIKDVCDSLCQKLIYRHPHVFGDTSADTAQKVEQSWEQLKLKEKGGNKTVLEGVIDRMDADKMEAEFGDLFFSLINAARLYKIKPDNALERTNQKFIRRFNYLEEHTIQEGRSLKDMTLEEMDQLWNEAKAKGL